MALKNFFTGKSGVKFWVNIVMMVLIIVAVPVGALYMLDSFTHHGEKIEVPNVLGKSLYDAETMLKDRGLVALVVDSMYDKSAPRGSVLEQSPKSGYEVKGGRMVYLTVNLKGEPMAQLPDVVGHGSLREAVALLQSLGFKLTAHKPVLGRPKDLVLGVKQGTRDVHAGETIPRDRPLTLVIGGGEIDSTMYEDEFDVEDDFEDVNIDEDGEDFDIEL
ncbi:MAG: PASTA domain-containing protein [Bacteroidaceae bacterium]|jgi:beta-lactam-binding protein with PASTA domain|nr:PASTA domain-containing protein [Bacteroidaceae bacterium]MBR1492305.1 PASTA domain-containing protein [Bacteroidaceae bacterium]MDY6256798.1 PASTA domain-containing protein [Bacteroidaceae bacterium]